MASNPIAPSTTTVFVTKALKSAMRTRWVVCAPGSITRGIDPPNSSSPRRRGSVSKSASRPSTTRWRSGISSGFAPTRFTAVESGFRLHRSLRSHRPRSTRGADALAEDHVVDPRAHMCCTGGRSAVGATLLAHLRKTAAYAPATAICSALTAKTHISWQAYSFARAVQGYSEFPPSAGLPWHGGANSPGSA